MECISVDALDLNRHIYFDVHLIFFTISFSICFLIRFYPLSLFGRSALIVSQISRDGDPHSPQHGISGSRGPTQKKLCGERMFKERGRNRTLVEIGKEWREGIKGEQMNLIEKGSILRE